MKNRPNFDRCALCGEEILNFQLKPLQLVVDPIEEGEDPTLILYGKIHTICRNNLIMKISQMLVKNVTDISVKEGTLQ
jgi:hypothetical protein